MSVVDSDRFGLNQGRERPPFKPRDIHCAGCGAGLSVKNEHSELVVCEYCESHLEVTQEEATVLGKGPGRKWEFPIALGDPFRSKGTRFEVIARLALIEDGDLSELTRQYLLYNPRRGTMWLSEYKGHYDLSTATHVMPAGDPFLKSRGDVLQTHDGRQWVMQEAGEYELAYVDGALPWLASIGDRQRYAELSAKSGSGESFEVEAHGDEIEYSTGRRVPPEQVRRALGKPDLAVPAAALEDAAVRRGSFRLLIALCAASLVLNGLLSLVFMFRGTEVLRQSFNAQGLPGETLSQPFRVARDSGVIKIVSRADLDNAWMALDIGLVEGDDTVILVEDADIEYYHGVEGGESWSEGSRQTKNYVLVPQAGTYRLLVHAVSAGGEASQTESCQHHLEVRVIDGAARHQFFFAAGVLSLICMVIVGARYSQWKRQEED